MPGSNCFTKPFCVFFLFSMKNVLFSMSVLQNISIYTLRYEVEQLNNGISLKNTLYWKFITKSFSCLSTYFTSISIHRWICIFHCPKQCSRSSSVTLFNNFALTSSTYWKCVSFNIHFTLGTWGSQMEQNLVNTADTQEQ